MHHHFLRRIFRRWLTDFETNPVTQIRFHFAMMIFWMINLAAGTVVVILYPELWLKIGVYYVFALSIYANWDTDYGAVSAAQASHGTERLSVGLEVQGERVDATYEGPTS